MFYLYSFLALDIATRRTNDIYSLEYEHEWEAREAREAAKRASVGQEQPSVGRRTLARGLAAVSRGSAAAARRLDAVTADDLGRKLAPTK